MPQEKWYNILTDTLPDIVEVDGERYPIHTNFRDWISFFLLHEDKELTDIEKIHISMNWYIERPDNMIAAYQALQEFAACQSLPKPKGKRQVQPHLFFPICTIVRICSLISCGFIKSICRTHSCIGLRSTHYSRACRRTAAQNSGLHTGA